MEKERLRRYKDKINHIEKRHMEILEWTTDYPAEKFIRDDKTKLAVTSTTTLKILLPSKA